MKELALSKSFTNDLLGYADPNYALALSEFGKPRLLSHCSGWILERPIPETALRDAMGCYPLFSCKDWTKLHEDLKVLSKTLVSLTIVTNPMGDFSLEYLQQNFDIVNPFKTHFIADLRQPLNNFVSKGHRRNARRSLKLMDVEICYQPSKYIEDWLKLYNHLIRRHNITGINAFSRNSFEIQLNIPGMIMLVGRQQGTIIGAMLILIQNNNAHAHLSAFSDEGYKIRASYGLHWKSLVYLLDKGIRYVHFGSAAGLKDNTQDGLSQFKQGWSNEHRPVYLCGRIFDQSKYEYLAELRRGSCADYFPAYRAGEY